MTQIMTADGLRLFTRQWAADPKYIAENGAPRGSILFVHGFGEHSGRYQHVAAFFCEAGFNCMAYDHRGHGNSEGKRGHTPAVDNYFDDLQLVLDQMIADFGNKNPIIWAHSMGGNVALNFLIRRKPLNVSLAVVTSAWIQLAFQPNAVLLTLGKMMRNIYPSFTQDSKLDANTISTDKKVVADYVNDPLVHSSVSASAGMGLQDSGAFLDNFDGKIDIPLLMMHGSKDGLISPDATLRFSKRVKGDVDFKMWEGLFHETHNEPNQREVFQFALGWLEAKL
jgi:alpha-beta hydrolase superfamily lysophospholipase